MIYRARGIGAGDKNLALVSQTNWVGMGHRIVLEDTVVNFNRVSEMKGNAQVIGTGKKGRPRAIPQELKGIVVQLHEQGNGYRTIARILRTEHGISPDWSSVRRLLKENREG